MLVLSRGIRTEQHVLEGVARCLRKAANDPFGVFNAAEDRVLRAGRVHVDRLVLEAFIRAIARCADPGREAAVVAGLRPLRLANIEADRAWFL